MGNVDMKGEFFVTRTKISCAGPQHVVGYMTDTGRYSYNTNHDLDAIAWLDMVVHPDGTVYVYSYDDTGKTKENCLVARRIARTMGAPRDIVRSILDRPSTDSVRHTEWRSESHGLHEWMYDDNKFDTCEMHYHGLGRATMNWAWAHSVLTASGSEPFFYGWMNGHTPAQMLHVLTVVCELDGFSEKFMWEHMNVDALFLCDDEIETFGYMVADMKVSIVVERAAERAVAEIRAKVDELRTKYGVGTPSGTCIVDGEARYGFTHQRVFLPAGTSYEFDTREYLNISDAAKMPNGWVYGDAFMVIDGKPVQMLVHLLDTDSEWQVDAIWRLGAQCGHCESCSKCMIFTCDFETGEYKYEF